jgi:hypothetical protein
MNKWSNKCVVHGVVIHIGKAKMNIFGEMGWNLPFHGWGFGVGFLGWKNWILCFALWRVIGRFIIGLME